jgi:hypothetical protein
MNYGLNIGSATHGSSRESCEAQRKKLEAAPDRLQMRQGVKTRGEKIWDWIVYGAFALLIGFCFGSSWAALMEELSK